MTSDGPAWERIPAPAREGRDSGPWLLAGHSRAVDARHDVVPGRDLRRTEARRGTVELRWRPPLPALPALFCDRVRLRRDHVKYLALIDAIALLHQHQREVRTVEVDGATVEYIEAISAEQGVVACAAVEVVDDGRTQ